MFGLTGELRARIVFAMEDRTRDTLIDLESGEILHLGAEAGTAPGSPASELSALPSWGGTEGFLLMEKFVSGLADSPSRASLSRSLAAGSGVFRRFKEALKAFPDMERRWRLFHDREMGSVVRRWYEGLREARGLEALDPELEAGEEAALADFPIRALSLEEAEASFRLFAAGPRLCPSLPERFRSFLVAETLARAKRAFSEGRALFLEADLPAAEGAEGGDAAEEGGAVGLLLSEIISLPGNERGLSISFCAASPDMEGCGIEELLREEAMRKSSAAIAMEMRWSSEGPSEDGTWKIMTIHAKE